MKRSGSWCWLGSSSRLSLIADASTDSGESQKPRGCSMRLSTCSAGSGSPGPVNIRRAVERPIPVVATTRSKILLLCTFDALRY